MNAIRSAALILLLLLTGCWDTRELKNIRMVNTAGVDLLDNNNLRLTVSIPTVKSPSDIQGKVVTPKVSGEGHSVQEASFHLQKIVSQHMDLRETRVLVINKALAEKDVYETLDFFFREADFPINILMAVTDVSAHDIVQLNVEDRSLISEYLHDLIISNGQQGYIPKESPYLVPSVMMTPGIDNTIPFINPTAKKDRAEIEGLALIHSKKMTGKLDELHSRSFVMLSRNRSYGSITEPIGSKGSYITFNYQRSKHKIKLKETEKGLKVDILVTLRCDLMDNPTGESLNPQMLTDMEHKLEDILTKRGEETIRDLQKANCDGIGIGLEVKEKRHRLWEKMDWTKEFPVLSITPHFEVKINNQGLLS